MLKTLRIRGGIRWYGFMDEGSPFTDRISPFWIFFPSLLSISRVASLAASCGISSGLYFVSLQHWLLSRFSRHAPHRCLSSRLISFHPNVMECAAMIARVRLKSMNWPKILPSIFLRRAQLNANPTLEVSSHKTVIVQNAQCSKLNQQWPACHRCDNNHTPFPKLGTVPITYTAKKNQVWRCLKLSIWKTHILRGAEFVDIGIYNTFNKKWSIPPSLARSRVSLFLKKISKILSLAHGT